MTNSQGNPRGGGISRRGFLTGTGAAAAATLAPAAHQAAAQQAGEVATLGPAPVRVELTVNGQKLAASVEPRVTLLDALRNYLDVTGCKRVCDRGTCGACTVLVEGKPIYSCTMLAVEAQGKPIRTAESLGGGQIDRVPAAFAQHDAPQCGLC